MELENYSSSHMRLNLLGRPQRMRAQAFPERVEVRAQALPECMEAPAGQVRLIARGGIRRASPFLTLGVSQVYPAFRFSSTESIKSN